MVKKMNHSQPQDLLTTVDLTWRQLSFLMLKSVSKAEEAEGRAYEEDTHFWELPQQIAPAPHLNATHSKRPLFSPAYTIFSVLPELSPSVLT